MPYARADLVTEALGNLGILLQPDTGATRTRAELVTETAANLGVIQQAFSGANRTRAELLTEAYANLGFIYQADTAAIRSSEELVAETLSNLGLVQQTDAGPTRTRVELVAQAARYLGILPAGQTLEAEDNDIIDPIVDTVIADLNARAVVTIVNANAIPGAVFDALSAVLANACKPSYETTADEASVLATKAAIAEHKLQNFGGAGIVDEKLPSIIGELNARGVVTVANLGAIPGAWFSALADIVAESVKGKFHIAADRSAEIAARAVLAERKLKIITQAPLVDEKIPSILADLQARMIVSIADPNAIPTQYFSGAAALVAESVKGKFELTADTVARITADAQKAENDLKTVTRLSIVDEKLPSIISELNARMIATVTNIEAIPSAWFSSIADIAAESVKGKFQIAPPRSAEIAQRAGRAEVILRNLNRSILIERNLDSILAEISIDDLVTVVDDSDIPQEWFRSLAAIVADKVKGKFDLTADVIMRVAADGAEAVQTLRRVTRGRPSYNRAIPEWI